MPTGINQLGADAAHGAVVGGEGFIQLGHVPADGGFFLNQKHLESLVCQVKGGLHPSDAAADNHHRANRWLGGVFIGTGRGLVSGIQHLIMSLHLHSSRRIGASAVF